MCIRTLFPMKLRNVANKDGKKLLMTPNIPLVLVCVIQHYCTTIEKCSEAKLHLLLAKKATHKQGKNTAHEIERKKRFEVNFVHVLENNCNVNYNKQASHDVVTKHREGLK